jgi:hypothetical protein
MMQSAFLTRFFPKGRMPRRKAVLKIAIKVSMYPNTGMHPWITGYALLL